MRWPALALLLVSAAAQAQGAADGSPEAREAELFGEPERQPLPVAEDPREAELFGEPEPPPPPAPALEEAPFGEPLLSDAQIGGRLDAAHDPLALGGKAYMRLQYSLSDGVDPESAALSAPNLLDLYLDGRPNDRVRAFVRWRLRYDYTVTDGDTDALGQPVESLSTSLDQLWLKWDLGRLVYVTLGRQPVRWGSGRFWNPTDFLNAQRKDPLAIFDERLGVGLLKLHLPLESLAGNLYAVANLEGASSPNEVGGAIRAEVLLGDAEIAASAAARKDDPVRLGLDVSSALWDLDVRAEGAVVHGEDRPFYRGEMDLSRLVLPEEYSREDDWIPQVAAGAEVSVLYSDQDSVVLGGEYFFNDAGVGDPDLYLAGLLDGEGFVPFYLGRHYAAAYAMLAAPGDWNDTTVVTSAIGNLSDGTWLARLDWGVRVLTYLDVNAFAALHLGEAGGELRFEAEDPTKGEVVYPAPRLDVGLWLTLAI